MLMKMKVALTRRDFVKTSAVALAATVAPPRPLSAAPAGKKTIGLQVGAVSFVDEGTGPVLDILQERGAVDTICLTTFTYGRGLGGRQIPGQPFPDHGKQEYDEKTFHGGNYATPHPQFYEKTALKQTRAPDHGDVDVLEMVLPKTRQRGVKVYCWYEDQFDARIPNVEQLQEVDLAGRRARTLCAL